MLGSPCSPCCGPTCKPSEMPDYVEVDIQSSSEIDQYAFIHYRLGRDFFTSECEKDYADAYLAYGIPSGTYALQNILTFGSPLGSQARFAYAGNGFAVVVDINASSETPSSRGFSLSVNPFRIVIHSKTWFGRLGGTASVATEQELRAVSDELGQAGRTIAVSGQITNIKKTLLNEVDFSSEPFSRNVYGYFAFPCVGNAVAFLVGSALPAASFPLSFDLSANIRPSYIARFVNTQFITDAAVAEQWDNTFFPGCGKRFPLPYLIDVGGAFNKTFDATEIGLSVDRVPLSIRRVAYEWNVSRQFSITAVRGRMSDGREIPLT